MAEVHEINIVFDGVPYCFNVVDADMKDHPFEDGGCYASYSKSDRDYHEKVFRPYRKDFPCQEATDTVS